MYDVMYVCHVCNISNNDQQSTVTVTEYILCEFMYVCTHVHTYVPVLPRTTHSTGVHEDMCPGVPGTRVLVHWYTGTHVLRTTFIHNVHMYILVVHTYSSSCYTYHVYYIMCSSSKRVSVLVHSSHNSHRLMIPMHSHNFSKHVSTIPFYSPVTIHPFSSTVLSAWWVSFF